MSPCFNSPVDPTKRAENSGVFRRRWRLPQRRRGCAVAGLAQRLVESVRCLATRLPLNRASPSTDMARRRVASAANSNDTCTDTGCRQTPHSLEIGVGGYPVSRRQAFMTCYLFVTCGIEMASSQSWSHPRLGVLRPHRCCF